MAEGRNIFYRVAADNEDATIADILGFLMRNGFMLNLKNPNG
jgi:hypothetical protein